MMQICIFNNMYLFEQEILYIANELENRFGDSPKDLYYSCYDIESDNENMTVSEIMLSFGGNDDFRISMFLRKTTNFTGASQKQLTQGSCLEFSVTTHCHSFQVLHTFLEHWSLKNYETTDTGDEPCLRFY